MDDVNSSISIEEDEEYLSNLIDDEINVHFDFSVWNCFRRFISLEKLHTLRQQSLIHSRSISAAREKPKKVGGATSHQLPPLYEEGNASSDENENDDNQKIQNDIDNVDVDYSKKLVLTNEEKLDNATWRLRLAADHVFSKLYVPNAWQHREMEAIAELLALLNPASNPGYLNDPRKQATKRAISSIFFPDVNEHKSILLKRGPVLLLNGEERELMLFTTGFILARVEFDEYITLLLDVSSGRINQLTPAQLSERFGISDNISSLSEIVLDKLMKRFNPSANEYISEEFKLMLNELQESRQNRTESFWRGLDEKLKRDLAKTSVTRKLDVAFQMSEVEWIEKLEHRNAKESSVPVDAEFAPVAFAISTKDTDDPLILVCSKPAHAEAWVEAFHLCIAWNSPTIEWPNDDTLNLDDQYVESFPADWRSSRIDWGVDDDDNE